jgi:3-oxoacyl-[acyl-carrier-protein] synthase-3
VPASWRGCSEAPKISAASPPSAARKAARLGRVAYDELPALWTVDQALAANGLTHADIDWLVPHQANQRIIEAMGKKLNLQPERVVVSVDRHANTSAASIPLALAEARGDGRIKNGDLVVMEAIGGGLTWGSAIARF